MDSTQRVNTDPRRGLPAVHRLAAEVRARWPEVPEWASLAAAREILESARRAFDSGAPVEAPSGPAAAESEVDRLITEACDRARMLTVPRPRRVINATGVVLPGKRERTFLGIYSLEGDTLKWCVDNRQKERPTEFRSAGGKYLLVLKRKS